MRYLIGIDDTDNYESRGTGFHSRQLGKALVEAGLAELAGITRHQLFIDDAIPYTSHNSSACIEINTKNIETCKQFCETHLLQNYIEGSDIGLCIAQWEIISDSIIDFGKKAKNSVLTKHQAQTLAKDKKIFLKGLSGTNDGIIGSLAAIGLRKSGNDGRFIWTKGKDLREISGIYSSKTLFEIADFDKICDINNNSIKSEVNIDTGSWIRPVLQNNKKVIIVEHKKTAEYEYTIANKDYIKRISN